MHFTKMEGAGNDYIYFDCFENDIRNLSNLKQLIIKYSDRHFGIGADGVVLICPSEKVDAKMIMYNADGSEGNMCGNAIRCVGKYVYEKGICKKNTLKIETRSGIKDLKLDIQNNIVKYVTVNMGSPVLKCKEIPVISKEETFISKKINVDGQTYIATCVSMGNPHIIVFANNIDNLDLEKIGPKFENHKLFPERINTEFVEILNNTSIKVRVWERGSGETLCCGTGASASVVASVLNNKVKENKEIKVTMKGGNLFITFNGKEVVMKGPATEVFSGKI